MANELPTVTYNSQSLSEYGPLIGRYTYETNGKEARFSQDFLVIGATASAFTTACLDIEQTLNTANAALAVTWENETYLAHSPSTNTGLQTRGRVIKRGDDQYDQQRSRRYTFEFTCLLPASEWRADTDTARGYFETQVVMQKDATGRPIFTFQGEYRAEKDIAGGGVKSAIDTYTAATHGAKARALAWLVANADDIAGSAFATDANPPTNYELIEEAAPVDDQTPASPTEGTAIQYRLVYRFRMIPENATPGAEAGIIIESMVLTYVRDRRMGIIALRVGGAGGGAEPGTPAGRGLTIPAGGAAGVQPDVPLMFRVDFDIACLYSSSNDYNDLRAYYTGTIRSFLTQHLADVWAPVGRGGWMLRSESVPIRTDANRVAVSWVVEVPNSANFYGLEYSLEYAKDHRRTFLKLGTGDDDQYDEFSPAPAKFATQKASGTILTNVTDPVSIDALIPRLGGPWRPVGRDVVAVSPMTTFNTDGIPLQIVDFQILRMYQLNRKQPRPGAVFTIPLGR